MGPPWSRSYGSWIDNYMCNQCLSPLTLWVWISLRRGVLDTTVCDKIWQWLAVGRWFSPGTGVSSTNKTDRHDITEILLKVALNALTLTLTHKPWNELSPFLKSTKYLHIFLFRLIKSTAVNILFLYFSFEELTYIVDFNFKNS